MSSVFRKALPLLFGAGALLAAAPAQSQEWPSKPVHFVSPGGPGSSVDIFIRVLAAKLSERTGWSTVVENRPGGDFVPSSLYVLQSPPDGYTILEGVSALPILPLTFKNMPFDLLKDFAYITRIGIIDTVMAMYAGIPVNNLQELIAYSKANPGKITFAATGASNSTRLLVEQLKMLSGLDATFVNYKTGTALLPDLLAGRISLGVTALGNVAAQVRSGKLRAIMLTQPWRNEELPEAPSTADVGYPQIDAGAWIGLMVPAKTPRAIIERIHKEVTPILKSPEVKASYAKGGATPMSESPDEFKKRVESDLVKWEKIARDANIKFN